MFFFGLGWVSVSFGADWFVFALVWVWLLLPTGPGSTGRFSQERSMYLELV